MSSTAVEFGLLNTLRTGNVMIDTMLCMLIPMLIQKLYTWLQNSQSTLWQSIAKFFRFRKEKPKVARVIEITQRFNQYGRVYDHQQKNHLLQKAIAMYLADILDLRNKNAQYELMEKPKKSTRRKEIKDLEDDSGSVTSSSSYDSDEELDEVDTYYGEVDKLNWEAMPPLNEWIEVESGVLFKHETVAPEGQEESNNKSLKETKVIFRFQSDLPDGSDRIDDLIDRAFTSYRTMERKKYTSDKARYMYIPSSDLSSSTTSEDTTASVTYKRYALSEEKCFGNLFFDGKRHLLQLLDNFMGRKGKFAIKGFPYKLGLLLHGPPGTGKTSMIKAIAQYTKRHVVTISLARIRTNQQLMDLLFDLKFNVEGQDLPVKMTFEDLIFVMEDIDCASTVVMARDKKNKESNKPVMDHDTKEQTTGPKTEEEELLSTMLKFSLMEEGPKNKPNGSDRLNLSGLLNVMDGVIDSPGRIVIMTTNHPEKLDPALIRPGRVNKKLLLGYMGATEMQEMMEYYCDTTLTCAQREKLQTIAADPSKTWTPAEVEELCAEYDHVDEVLDQLATKVATAVPAGAAVAA